MAEQALPHVRPRRDRPGRTRRVPRRVCAGPAAQAARPPVPCRRLRHRATERFVAELARRADRIRLGRGTDPGVECGPLVSAAQRERTEGVRGLRPRRGSRAPLRRRTPRRPGYFYRPTALDRCHRGMRVVREEVFGPVLTVETFRSEAEAVTLANDTEYGLVGAVWTSDPGRARRVAGRLRHGTVRINDFHPHLPQAEWGGFGKSGTGRELGPSGLAEYRETKHVYQNLAPRPVRWFAG
ncbi:aldehyde dehydrogenase family protein [Streptomyces sp. NPDC090021]|uniref:aldehyde dehydrogenase family protein n=1 Tax=Streptomyces sp. NPDC090021 TaxID=3365919 RepID=UPI003815C481